MALLSKPSPAARAALLYITLGSLTLVWSIVWYFWLRSQHAQQDVPFFSTAQDYVCLGTLLTGLTLLVIGLAVGRIGRAARHAELPPPEATPTVAQTDRLAAGTGQVAAPAPQAPVAPGSLRPPATQPVAAVPAVPAAAQPVPPSQPAVRVR
jgi:hypothetical protein